MILNKCFILLIVGLRPLLGPAQCRFEVGCTSFALEQLKTSTLFKALYAIAKRLLLCSPLNKFLTK